MPADDAVRTRPMTPDDVAFGMELKGIAGWNQTEADWQRIMACGGDGVMVAELDGARAAVVAAIAYGGSYGWIAMLLVHPDHRRKGVATSLMKRSVDYLEGLGVRTIGLDATDAGRPLYERLGFADRGTVVRYTGTGFAAPSPECAACEHLTDDDLAAIGAVDAARFGADRSALLTMIAADTPDVCHIAPEDGRPPAYIMGRTGTDFLQLGPCVAPDADTALSLAAAALSRAGELPICADAPLDSRHTHAFVDHLGLVEQRRFTRMELGDAPSRTSPHDVVFTCGPEYG